MKRLFNSLRFRIVATFVGVVGLINAFLGLSGVYLREQQVRHQFDGRLEQRADAIAARVVDQPGGVWPDQQTLQQIIDEQTRGLNFSDFYVQLHDEQGDVVLRSQNLGTLELPLAGEDRARVLEGERALVRVTGEALQTSLEVPGSLRMLRRELHRPGEQSYVMQVATSLEAVEQAGSVLVTLFGIAMPLSLFAAAVAGWVVTDRALTRIDIMSRLTGAVQAGSLEEHVRLPEGTDELGGLARGVNQMLARLEKAFAAQDRFIANASHELRTPIAVLLSESQVLDSDDADLTELLAFRKSVEEEMRRMYATVDSLLSLVRMETGEGDGRDLRQPVPLHDLVTQSVERVHGLATGRGVPVRVQLPDPEGGDGEPIVLGDPGLLAVMVENLVRNAVRLTEEGSPVHVVLAPGDGRALRLSVTDRGPGISQDTIDLMHDGEAAERRVESPRVKGTILSLSIASQIAKLHAGRIEAGNTDEGGARVTVWLPRAGDQVQPGGGSKPGPAAAGDASAS